MFFGFFHLCDLAISFTFHICKKIMESSIIFLRNDVLILNGKENKEDGSICFEIRSLRTIFRESFVLLHKELNWGSSICMFSHCETLPIKASPHVIHRSQNM